MEPAWSLNVRPELAPVHAVVPHVQQAHVDLQVTGQVHPTAVESRCGGQGRAQEADHVLEPHQKVLGPAGRHGVPALLPEVVLRLMAPLQEEHLPAGQQHTPPAHLRDERSRPVGGDRAARDVLNRADPGDVGVVPVAVRG